MMDKIVEEVQDKIIELKIKNIKPIMIVIDRTSYLELKKSVNFFTVYGSKMDINEFLGIPVSVFYTNKKYIKVFGEPYNLEDKITENELEILKYSSPTAYEGIKYLIDRGVPYNKLQLNLMTIKRGYGKTFMSYGLVILDARGKGKFKVEPSKYDSDVSNINNYKYWVKGFEKFLQKYFPDNILIKDVDGIYLKTI